MLNYSRLLFIVLILTYFSSISRAENNPFGIVSNNNTKVKRAVMIVLDSSGSMAENMTTTNGKKQSRMASAREVLEKTIRQLSNEGAYIGLRVYGANAPSGMDMYAGCDDTQLLVPAGLNNRATILSKISALSPKGATPISLAMREAMNDLNMVRAEEKIVLLISDGMDTCGYDPCMFANNLNLNKAKVQFNVVGLGISDSITTDQLSCIAKETKGKYYSANSSEELANSISDGINYYSTSVSAQITEIPNKKK